MTSSQLALERTEKEKILLSQFSEKTSKAFLESIIESRRLHKDADDIKSFLSSCFNGIEAPHSQKYSSELMASKGRVLQAIDALLLSDCSQEAQKTFISTWLVLGRQLQEIVTKLKI